MAIFSQSCRAWVVITYINHLNDLHLNELGLYIHYGSKKRRTVEN